jgi:hypothetical protein
MALAKSSSNWGKIHSRCVEAVLTPPPAGQELQVSSGGVRTSGVLMVGDGRVMSKQQ